MAGRKPKKLTMAKARKILRDKKVRGKSLTEKQEGFFGARASGVPATPKKKKKRTKHNSAHKAR